MNEKYLINGTQKWEKRLQKLNDYLERVEEFLFNVEEVSAERPRPILFEEYQLARKAQIDILELVRKIVFQQKDSKSEEIDAATLELAKRLQACSDNELQNIKKHLTVVK